MTLLERHPQAPLAWHGDLPVSSRYTYGLAGERFFRMIKEEGKILGTFCKNCEHTYVPATQFCEKCLSEISDWVEVGAIGELHTYTVLYEGYDGNQLDKPQFVAFIKFGDGGLVHRLGEIHLDDIYFGMPLEAVYKPREERVGSILDIKYFKPVT